MTQNADFGQEDGAAPSSPMPANGFFPINHAGVLKLLLEAGETFEDQLLRAGMSQDDASDVASMFRAGLRFQVPELVLHASHMLIAAAGEEDKAKLFALAGIGGNMAQVPSMQRPSYKFNLRDLMKKGKIKSNSL